MHTRSERPDATGRFRVRIPDWDGEGEIIFGPPDDDDPEGSEKEASVEVDPVLADFMRSPYDPVYGARALGHLTGKAIVDVPQRWGGLRLAGGVFALLLLLVGVTGVWFTLDALLNDAGSAWVGETVRALAVAVPASVAGALLLRRLRHSESA